MHSAEDASVLSIVALGMSGATPPITSCKGRVYNGEYEQIPAPFGSRPGVSGSLGLVRLPDELTQQVQPLP